MAVVPQSPSTALGEAGMVYAFAVKDGKARAHRPLAAEAVDFDFVWIHVNFATEPGRQWLMRHSGLPPQLASMMLDRNEDAGAQVFGSGCLIVLEDRQRDFDADGGEMAEIHVWLEPNRLITGRWKPLAATDRLRFRLEVGDAPPTASALFFDLLEETVADLENFGRKVRRRFDALEDMVLDDAAEGIAGELGAIRREAIKLRRRAMPLRQLFARLQNTLPAWVKDEEGERFDPLLTRVERAIGDLQECVEQSRLLHDEFAARSAERSGRNLYILSVLSAVMLPLNLVTGLFGMNVAGLPGLENHAAFWWILAGMGAFTIAVMVWFKRKRWF
ncbi:CorA family divalent cation transporter [Magnetospirillum sp. 64-120]|uniref:magnesium transporter CorA family protein n=1 Tax=Magnetospirillum sp. 64-120 TaxID=1895778 RepID=UPI000AB146F9|nr:CorA family divalent cation transporter [Magnetospirillum sp. 64-120]